MSSLTEKIIIEALGNLPEKILWEARQLLVEKSKEDILVQKIGFSSDVAKYLSDTCGSLAVWMGNKLIDWQINLFSLSDKKKSTPEELKKGAIDLLNNNELFIRGQKIEEIMDWIRVGLDGNMEQYKNLTLGQLHEKSVEWHKSLSIGEGNIDYVDKNIILLDFRDKNGVGFYWADLNTNNSPEEKERMGHCGFTSGGNTLYSLRENRRINDKHTANYSHVTAAVSKDKRIVSQMRGSANSKPKEEYHQYIVPLILSEYIEGFRNSYKDEDNFKISDLSDDEIKKIYEAKPQLFTEYSSKKILYRLGIIEKPKMTFILKLAPHEIESHVKSDMRDGVIEDILSGNMDFDIDVGNWEQYLWKLDKKSIAEIWKILKTEPDNKAVGKNEQEQALEDAIEEFDDNDEVKDAITDAVRDSENGAYYDELYKKLKNALEEYGEVIRLDDTGAEIKIDLNNYLLGADDDSMDGYMENCNEELVCVFNELLGDGSIEKPKFYIDDRWSPYVSDKEFNQYFMERLPA